MLLSVYSLGLAIPFIISGYAVQRLINLSKKLRNYISYVSKVGGIILFLTGILILTNKLQALGFYFLEILPFLSKIGWGSFTNDFVQIFNTIFFQIFDKFFFNIFNN